MTNFFKGEDEMSLIDNGIYTEISSIPIATVSSFEQLLVKNVKETTIATSSTTTTTTTTNNISDNTTPFESDILEMQVVIKDGQAHIEGRKRNGFFETGTLKSSDSNLLENALPKRSNVTIKSTPSTIPYSRHVIENFKLSKFEIN